jgi:hypothetical protein
LEALVSDGGSFNPLLDSSIMEHLKRNAWIL